MGLTLGQQLKEYWLFTKQSAKEVPKGKYEVGTMGPTCGAVRRAIYNQFSPDTKHVVDIGAGTGALERELGTLHGRSRIPHLERWDALEPQPELGKFLSDTIRDPRVRFHPTHSSDLPDILGDAKADVIVTTVPKLPHAAQMEFTRMAFEHVKPGGIYIHAIFRDIRRLLAEATDLPVQEIELIRARGQLLPPVEYLIQIARKPK